MADHNRHWENQSHSNHDDWDQDRQRSFRESGHLRQQSHNEDITGFDHQRQQGHGQQGYVNQYRSGQHQGMGHQQHYQSMNDQGGAYSSDHGQQYGEQQNPFSNRGQQYGNRNWQQMGSQGHHSQQNQDWNRNQWQGQRQQDNQQGWDRHNMSADPYRSGYEGQYGQQSHHNDYRQQGQQYGSSQHYSGHYDQPNYGQQHYGQGRQSQDRNLWERTRHEGSFGSGNEQRDQRGLNRMGSGGHRGKGPKDYQRSSDRIREDICDRLADDEMVDASDINVQIQGSEVILTGTVETREQKRRAEDIIENISGVRNVENRIRVGNRNDHFSQHQYTGVTDQAGRIGDESGTTNEIIRNVHGDKEAEK